MHKGGMLQLLLCVVRTIKLHLLFFKKFLPFVLNFLKILSLLLVYLSCFLVSIVFFAMSITNYVRAMNFFCILGSTNVVFENLKVVMLTSNSIPYQFTKIDFFGSSFNHNDLLWSIDGFEINVHYVGRTHEFKILIF